MFSGSSIFPSVHLCLAVHRSFHLFAFPSVHHVIFVLVIHSNGSGISTHLSLLSSLSSVHSPFNQSIRLFIIPSIQLSLRPCITSLFNHSYIPYYFRAPFRPVVIPSMHEISWPLFLPLIHPFINQSVRPIIRPPIQWFIHPLMHPFIHPSIH